VARHPFAVPALLSSVLACASLPDTPHRPTGSADAGDEGDAVHLTTVPERAGSEIDAVVHLRLAGEGLRAERTVLVEGEISDVALRALAKGTLPASTESRRIPCATRNEGDALILIPARELPSTGSLTLAFAPDGGGASRLALSVKRTGTVARRVFPPENIDSTGDAAVFCGEAGIPAVTAVGLFPGVPPAVDRAFGAGARCVIVRLGAAPHFPSALVADDGTTLLLDPTPLQKSGDAPGAISPSCGASRIPLGPTCLSVEDDRLRVDVGTAPVMVQLIAGPSELLEPLTDAPLVLRGLVPDHPYMVSLRWLDLRGVLGEATASITTSLPRPRLVLTEALADAKGSEPAGEWVEIHNDGLVPVDLAGWKLEDSGGAVVLPGAQLEPGDVALLVPSAFSPDTPPDPGALLIDIGSLGDNGLSNAGEALALRDPAGMILTPSPWASPRPVGWRNEGNPPAIVIELTRKVGAATEVRRSRSSPSASMRFHSSSRFSEIVTSLTGWASFPSSIQNPEAPRLKSPVTALKPKPIISVT
jgi:hypothetical protein